MKIKIFKDKITTEEGGVKNTDTISRFIIIEEITIKLQSLDEEDLIKLAKIVLKNNITDLGKEGSQRYIEYEI